MKISLILNWFKLWNGDRKFIDSILPNKTYAEKTKIIRRVRLWRFLAIFWIKPKLKTWEINYTDHWGRKCTAYCINRALNIKKLMKEFENLNNA